MIVLFIYIVVLIILFGDTIGLLNIGFVSDYLDHMLTALLFSLGIIFMFKLYSNQDKKLLCVRRFLNPLILLSLIVFFRSVSNSNISIVGFFVGYFYFFKFAFLFVSGLGLGYYVKQINVRNSLHYLIILIFLILLICSMLNLFFPSVWHDIYGVQYVDGKARLMGPFTNAGRTSWLLVVLLIYILVFVKGIGNKAWMSIPIFILQLATFVKKSFFAYLLALLFFNKSILRKRSLFYKIIIWLVFLIVISVASYFASSYFERMVSEYSGDALNDGNARYMLALGALNIISDDYINFIFGAGLSSWGGYASSIVYSNYYHIMGMSDNWGFAPGSATYTGDFYLAHVIAEVGLLGSLIFCVILFRLYSIFETLSYPTNVKNYKFMIFFKLLYLHILIESLGISAMEISQMAILVFFVSGLYIGSCAKYYWK